MTWHGVEEFESDLERFADEVVDLPEKEQAGDLVAAAAAAGAPRLTGELAGSVQSKSVDDHMFVFATSDHAAPIIVGVPEHHIEPHPFIEAALATREATVYDLLERGVQRAADRI